MQIATYQDAIYAAKDCTNIGYIPYRFFDEKLWMILIEQNPMLLKKVAKNNRSEVLCWTAVRKDGCAIVYVPPQYRSREMIITSVLSNPRAIKLLPIPMRSYDTYLELVKRDGSLIIYIPKIHYNLVIWYYAYQQNPSVLNQKCIPEWIRTQIYKSIDDGTM